MTGSAFFIVIAVLITAAFTFFLSPLFLIPGAVVLFFLLVVGPLAGMMSRGDAGSATGTPTTADASYEPVSEPGQRAV